MTRRAFAKLCAAGAAFLPATAASAWNTADVLPDGQASAPATEDGQLLSELLFDLLIETSAPHNVGADRLIVPVSGGTFEGPRLKGTIVAPGGDWIVRRPDGSRVLDVRILLQTDDGQKIYMTWRGIGYTPPGGTLYARVLPMFETDAAKYAWLNNIVAVGVYRAVPGKVSYRVHRIL
jgi:uncharacterized protein DUF3237